MTPGRAETPHRSRWMRAGRECMTAGDWAGAIRAYGQGLMEQPLLGMHYAANLSHNAAGRCRGAMAARQDSGWLLSQPSVGAACRMSRGQQ
jgi:hypothetical protein